MRFRETKDVDFVIELTSTLAYWELEEELRERGFEHDTSPDAPRCRWKIGGLSVDAMPVDERVLGFSNRWYPYTMRTAVPFTYPDRLTVRIASPVAFLLTKIEAFRSPQRLYGNDYFASHDLEDALAVLDGRRELDAEINAAEAEVQTYLGQAFRRFLAEPDFLDALPGHLETGPTNAARVRLVLERLERLAAL